MGAVCVFCGSGPGRRPEYLAAGRETGREIARRGLTLVYGGGGKGMMGAVADGALEAGGRVIGVIPYWMMAKEAAHPGATEMVQVSTMLERKQEMADRSDAFVVLPGGLGTLDELFEMATWSQLRLHGVRKPLGIVNTSGYFDALLAWLDRAVEDGYVSPDTQGLPQSEATPARLLDRLLG